MRFRNQNQNYKTVISLYTVQGIDFLEPLKLFMKIHYSSSFFGKKEKKSVTQSLWQNFNIKGDDKFESGVPESFNVLVNEIKSLGLDIDLV